MRLLFKPIHASEGENSNGAIQWPNEPTAGWANKEIYWSNSETFKEKIAGPLYQGRFLGRREEVRTIIFVVI